MYAELMLACAEGPKDSGKFLLREGREQHETIITVLYRGKPVHEAVIYEPGVSTSYTVNGCETGQTTMQAVSHHLVVSRARPSATIARPLQCNMHRLHASTTCDVTGCMHASTTCDVAAYMHVHVRALQLQDSISR